MSSKSKIALNKKREELDKKRKTRKKRQSVIMKKIDNIKKTAKRKRALTSLNKLKKENEQFRKKMDKENLEFEDDAIALLQSLETEKPQAQEKAVDITPLDINILDRKIATDTKRRRANSNVLSQRMGAKIIGKVKFGYD